MKNHPECTKQKATPVHHSIPHLVFPAKIPSNKRTPLQHEAAARTLNNTETEQKTLCNNPCHETREPLKKHRIYTLKKALHDSPSGQGHEISNKKKNPKTPKLVRNFFSGFYTGYLTIAKF